MGLLAGTSPAGAARPQGGTRGGRRCAGRLLPTVHRRTTRRVAAQPAGARGVGRAAAPRPTATVRDGGRCNIMRVREAPAAPTTASPAPAKGGEAGGGGETRGHHHNCVLCLYRRDTARAVVVVNGAAGAGGWGRYRAPDGCRSVARLQEGARLAFVVVRRLGATEGCAPREPPAAAGFAEFRLPHPSAPIPSRYAPFHGYGLFPLPLRF